MRGPACGWPESTALSPPGKSPPGRGAGRRDTPEPRRHAARQEKAMSKNYQAIEGGYGSVPVTPGMVGAADRIRTGDGQLGKPPKGHPRISRALLLHSLTSWTESVDSSRSPLR